MNESIPTPQMLPEEDYFLLHRLAESNEFLEMFSAHYAVNKLIDGKYNGIDQYETKPVTLNVLVTCALMGAECADVLREYTANPQEEWPEGVRSPVDYFAYLEKWIDGGHPYSLPEGASMKDAILNKAKG